MQIWQSFKENEKLIRSFATLGIIPIKILLWHEIYLAVDTQEKMMIKRHEAVMNIALKLNISQATIYRALKFMETEITEKK